MHAQSLDTMYPPPEIGGWIEYPDWDMPEAIEQERKYAVHRMARRIINFFEVKEKCDISQRRFSRTYLLKHFSNPPIHKLRTPRKLYIEGRRDNPHIAILALDSLVGNTVLIKEIDKNRRTGNKAVVFYKMSEWARRRK